MPHICIRYNASLVVQYSPYHKDNDILLNDMKLKAAVIQVSGMKYIMEQDYCMSLGKNKKHRVVNAFSLKSVCLCVIGDNKGFKEINGLCVTDCK